MYCNNLGFSLEEEKNYHNKVFIIVTENKSLDTCHKAFEKGSLWRFFSSTLLCLYPVM